MCESNRATDKPISSSSAAPTTRTAKPMMQEAWARNLIPQLGELSHRWSGQVLDTIDDATFIGRNPGNERICVHTGDSGKGMTHGVVGSLLSSALILGKEAKWTDVYDSMRNNVGPT
jgi:glycine/D-amino acid oxidase-like deaminating enzyme